MWVRVGALIGRTYHGGAVTLTDAASSCHKVIIDNPQIWIFYNLDGTIRNSGKYAVVMPPIPLVSAHPSDLR